MPTGDQQCGQRRPGWGPGVGRHRVLCTLPSGHHGDHRDAFSQSWRPGWADDALRAPETLTAREAAARLGVTPGTVRRRVRTGQMPGQRSERSGWYWVPADGTGRAA
ncbi:helix-turn-helix domain-containing protein [Nocardiopsis chromatogenes]|uniref:helix-turn-helix domain-containing protein n=1 Tax=Nocardiopsis chromatogenes TaxID=280239 RepID=UPI00034D68A8|nr:helix-turn-helix domain-containing protein [Nocardiopsis chromatogenes]